jgi:hypothetical protein
MLSVVTVHSIVHECRASLYADPCSDVATHVAPSLYADPCSDVATHVARNTSDDAHVRVLTQLDKIMCTDLMTARSHTLFVIVHCIHTTMITDHVLHMFRNVMQTCRGAVMWPCTSQLYWCAPSKRKTTDYHALLLTTPLVALVHVLHASRPLGRDAGEARYRVRIAPPLLISV